MTERIEMAMIENMDLRVGVAANPANPQSESADIRITVAANRANPANRTA
jgi:hypothetical protein